MEKSKPKNILLYMGGRTELDNRCREIIEKLPPGTNVNEFIKQAIVVYIDGKPDSELPPGSGQNNEIEQLKSEMQEIRREIQRLKNSGAEPRQETAPEENAEVENKINSLFDSF